MNTLNVWKDLVILNWDGSCPESAPKEALHAEDDVRHFWPHVKNFTHYSKKLNGFVFGLSKNNLLRIHSQFGKIPVNQGQFRIDALKKRNQWFYGMIAMAEKIKTGGVDFKLNYKVPPLADYQHKTVLYLMCVPRAPLFADCGLGKSFSVLTSTEQQIKTNQLASGKTLICGKLATLETGWMEDAVKFTDLKVVNLWLPQQKNKTVRREKFLERLNTPADIYLINHDGLRIYEDDLITKEFDKVVVDESTILKGFRGMSAKFKGGQFGRALMRVSERAKWRVIMSGTPAPNSAEDLWGQFHFLDPDGFLLEKSIYDFRSRWMDEIVFGKADTPNVPKKWVMRKDADKEISDLITPLVFRAKLRDHLKDMPERTLVKRHLPMNKDQTKHYNEMKEFLMTVIDDAHVPVTNRLAEIMKLRQITGGFLIDPQGEAHTIADTPKLDMLDDLINDEIAPDKKILIYAQYQWEIKTLAERYKEHGVVTVFGGNSSEVNLSNIKQFKDDKATRIIILHPKSAAHGITFVNAHYMVFYSISYSAEDNYQCIKRIERAGQKHPMFIYYLLCNDTIDETIYQVIQRKTNNQEKLIDQTELDDELFRSIKETL